MLKDKIQKLDFSENRHFGNITFCIACDATFSSSTVMERNILLNVIIIFRTIVVNFAKSLFSMKNLANNVIGTHRVQ